MSTDLDLAAAIWVKSSHSGANGGTCVEFSRTFTRSGIVPVRDSKNPNGPALLLSADVWTSFVDAVTGGEFPV